MSESPRRAIDDTIELPPIRTESERLADESEGIAYMHPGPDQVPGDVQDVPAWLDWIKGTPAALEAGRAALGALGAFHAGSASIRQAVATQQKRWGAVPTGALTPDQWDRLHAEHAATS